MKAIVLMILVSLLLGGGVMTAYAANSSLPGDTLFTLKSNFENARVRLTDDSALQARLYLQFAGQRLLETQSLIDQRRYSDIALATNEFAVNIQREIITAIIRARRATTGKSF